MTLLSAAILFLCSCSHTPPPSRDNMLKNKTFVYLFFATEKECLESQHDPDFFENCHQQVDFYKNNVVEIMLSDIIYRGKYTIKGSTVVLTFENIPEIPNGEIIFEILNPAQLRRVDNNTVWKRISGNSIWN